MNCRPVSMLSVLGICARILQINISFIQMCLGCAGDGGNQVGKGVVRGGGLGLSLSRPVSSSLTVFISPCHFSINTTHRQQASHPPGLSHSPSQPFTGLSRVRVSLSILVFPILPLKQVIQAQHWHCDVTLSFDTSFSVQIWFRDGKWKVRFIPPEIPKISWRWYLFR